MGSRMFWIILARYHLPWGLVGSRGPKTLSLTLNYAENGNFNTNYTNFNFSMAAGSHEFSKTGIKTNEIGPVYFGRGSYCIGLKMSVT